MSITRLLAPAACALALFSAGLALAPRVASAAPRAEDAADAAARKRAKVTELMTAMGQEAIMERTVARMGATFEKMGLPPAFGEKFVARFDADHVIEMQGDVFAEHLEESTVDAMLVFYASEEGKKLAAALPDITIESLEKGEAYGREIGEEVGRELGGR